MSRTPTSLITLALALAPALATAQDAVTLDPVILSAGFAPSRATPMAAPGPC